MGKSRRRYQQKNGFWESAAYNRQAMAMNLSMLVSLAINRFRWVNLPNTCDARFLEMALHRNGIATICHERELPDVWQSLYANPYGNFNAYGIPVSWYATGYDSTHYEVDEDNGELVYYSFSRMNPWNTIETYARKLTNYDRTEDVNLFHQHKPMILIAPQEKRLELENVLKQVSGYEPAILGDSNFANLAAEVTKIDTGVPLIVEELARGKQNCLNEYLLQIGIPHLAFEKGERMIEDEARANTAPTNIMLLDCLQARRQAANALNRRFGLDIEVYFNDDWESYNYNYLNNAESLAQDKVILSQDETFTGLMGGIEDERD